MEGAKVCKNGVIVAGFSGDISWGNVLTSDSEAKIIKTNADAIFSRSDYHLGASGGPILCVGSDHAIRLVGVNSAASTTSYKTDTGTVEVPTRLTDKERKNLSVGTPTGSFYDSILDFVINNPCD